MPRNRVGRGGKREGKPGVAYANRQDLNPSQPVRAAPGQEYGVRGQQEAAQQAIPLPATSPAGAPGGAASRSGPLPGEVTPLAAPTNRPGEPVTAGVPLGPGPGPEALQGMGDPTLDELREVYRRYPDEDLRELIAIKEAEGRG